MTAPTQELTDADIVKLSEKLLFTQIGEQVVLNPPPFRGAQGGVERPTSGIVYP